MLDNQAGRISKGGDLILSLINHLIDAFGLFSPLYTFALYSPFNSSFTMGSMENGHSTERRFGTLAVHAGAPHDPVTGAVIAPVRLRLFAFTASPASTELSLTIA